MYGILFHQHIVLSTSRMKKNSQNYFGNGDSKNENRCTNEKVDKRIEIQS